MTQKSAALVYFAAETWNHAFKKFLFGTKAKVPKTGISSSAKIFSIKGAERHFLASRTLLQDRIKQTGGTHQDSYPLGNFRSKTRPA